MAKSRSDDVFTVLWNLFIITPWWVCPLVALVVFLSLYLAIPLLLALHPILVAFANISQYLAPWAAIVVLIIGLAARIRILSGNSLLDKQSGLDSINKQTWQEFEELLAAAFRRQGYKVVETGGGGADGGIDLVLYRNDEKALVQCKHWRSSKVGVKPVRELHGLTHSKGHIGSRGIFVTSGTYTYEAIKFAKENRIDLIDRRALVKMIQSAQRNRCS